MSNLKVEGKVADFCPRCKNCKSTTREWDGEKDWLTEVECEDPYDGMIKTLAADSDICCSMFVPKPDRACEKCETKTSRETELEDKVSAYEKILNDILDTVYEHPEMFKHNMTAYELLPGSVKALENSWDMMCDKYDPLNVENEQRKKAMDNKAKMIRDLKYWKERCYNAESDVTTLTSEVGTLNNMYNRLKDKSDKEIENLKKENANLIKMVAKHEKLVDKLRGDVDTLQNECLVIVDIAKRAYDESIKECEMNE